jgi:excinuclease ABC subunit A
MTVDEAFAFFESDSISKSLKILRQVGIGHLRLDQAGNVLSGGEAQRLKLATSKIAKPKGKTLFLFDEPSTGLHYADILRLVSLFQSLVDNGATVLFIDHNKTLIQAANQVVHLDPGSGDSGGELMKRIH